MAILIAWEIVEELERKEAERKQEPKTEEGKKGLGKWLSDEEEDE